MPISKKALLAASFTEYEPLGATGDPHCVGYFQKSVAGAMLNVSFWRFKRREAPQVNFDTLAIDGELQVDIGMRGVPGRWTVGELEAYVAALLERAVRPRRRKPARQNGQNVQLPGHRAFTAIVRSQGGRGPSTHRLGAPPGRRAP